MPTELKPMTWSEVRERMVMLLQSARALYAPHRVSEEIRQLLADIDAAAPAMEQQAKDAAEVAKLRAELCDASFALSIHSGQRDSAMLTDEHKARIVRALHESWRRTQAAKAGGD